MSYNNENGQPNLIYFNFLHNIYYAQLVASLCESLWDWDIGLSWKIYFIRILCNYKHEYIASKLNIVDSASRRYANYVNEYIGEVRNRTLAHYGDSDQLSGCKRADSELEIIVCRSLEHAFFIRKVLEEVFLGRVQLWGLLRLAVQAHSRVFPVVFKFHELWRRRRSTDLPSLRVAQKADGRLYVSAPSGVYTYAILYPILVEHVKIVDFKDLFDVENIISEYIRRDLQTYIAGSDAGKLVYILTARAYRQLVAPYPSVIIPL